MLTGIHYAGIRPAGGNIRNADHGLPRGGVCRPGISVRGKRCMLLPSLAISTIAAHESIDYEGRP